MCRLNTTEQRTAMAATSPRKRRRTKGRHRRSSNFQASNSAHWLRVGAVGFGVAAAIASGQGIASATPDDSSKPSAPNDTTQPRLRPDHASDDRPNPGKRSPGADDTTSSSSATGAADDSPSPGPDRPRLRENLPTAPRIDHNRPGSKRPPASTVS